MKIALIVEHKMVKICRDFGDQLLNDYLLIAYQLADRQIRRLNYLFDP